MAVRLNTEEIAEATGGSRLGEVVMLDGASIDSRGDVAGRLFVPIVADRDGHDFRDAAVTAGAAAYLTARTDSTGRPAVAVDDTLVALADVGRLARSRLAGPVVGITGSVGKTSTKDLLAAVLDTTYATSSSRASFNNELGVPLTLVNAPEGAEVVVCEMGARGVGHIAMLCDIARPTVGIVTAIEGAHLEMFRSVEQVAIAKGELVEALPANGTAVLNVDSELVGGLAERTEAEVIRFGIERSDVDVVAESVRLDDALRPRFALRSSWGSTDVVLEVRGRHQISNALGAAAAALSIGVPLEAVAAGLAGASLSPMRMDVRHRSDGLLVIDDSYNANPTSMAAALAALGSIEAERKVAVLGSMAELGADEVAGHARISELADSLGIRVVAVGTELYPRAEAHVSDIDDALAWLAALHLGASDAVLVKGSRVAGLDAIVAALR